MNEFFWSCLLAYHFLIRETNLVEDNFVCDFGISSTYEYL